MTGVRPRRPTAQDTATLFFQPMAMKHTNALPIYLLTDCQDLVKHLSHLNLTLSERRLQGEFEDLSESLRSGAIEAIYWLRRDVIAADELTNVRTSRKIQDLKRTN